MSRNRPSLRPPAGHLSLRFFPGYRLEITRTLWRVIRDGLGPWWFGSSGASRFDLAAPLGTCYLASDDLGAILETVGPGLMPGGTAPARLLSGRHLRQLSVPSPMKLANALASRAAQWVTAEISTLTPYGLPQAWAHALQQAGFNGIRYAPRHTTSRRPFAVALFGAAGDAGKYADWPRGHAVKISAEHRRRLRDSCGITLFEIPFADELEFTSS